MFVSANWHAIHNCLEDLAPQSLHFNGSINRVWQIFHLQCHWATLTAYKAQSTFQYMPTCTHVHTTESAMKLVSTDDLSSRTITCHAWLNITFNLYLIVCILLNLSRKIPHQGVKGVISCYNYIFVVFVVSYFPIDIRLQGNTLAFYIFHTMFIILLPPFNE